MAKIPRVLPAQQSLYEDDFQRLFRLISVVNAQRSNLFPYEPKASIETGFCANHFANEWIVTLPERMSVVRTRRIVCTQSCPRRRISRAFVCRRRKNPFTPDDVLSVLRKPTTNSIVYLPSSETGMKFANLLSPEGNDFLLLDTEKTIVTIVFNVDRFIRILHGE